MLCERYKEALMEAAALGQEVEGLPPKVRQHLTICENCQSVFAAEQLLQIAIAGGLQSRVRVNAPASLMAGVRSQQVDQNLVKTPVPWHWATVGIALAMGLSIAVVRDRIRRPKLGNDVAVQMFSKPGNVTGPLDSRSATQTKRGTTRKGSPRRERRELAEPDVKPLMPPRQSEIVELVVRKIRDGELRKQVVRFDVIPETDEVHIAPIQIDSLGTLGKEGSVDPQKIANGQVRVSERSTR